MEPFRTEDNMDYMGDWMDRVFEMESGPDMFMTIEEAKNAPTFDLLALE